MTESENCDSKYQKVANHLIITQKTKGKNNYKKKKTNQKNQQEKDYVIYKMLYRNSHRTTKHRCSTDKHKNRKLRKQTWQTETQGKRNNGDLKQLRKHKTEWQY